MVYNERRYSSADDPDIDDSAFNKGDRNPPMEDAEDWVAEQVFGDLQCEASSGFS